jgi:hypothetical protein
LIPGAFLVDIIPILKYVMVPRCQVPEESCHDAKTCSKDLQYYICSDRGINGM